MKLQENNIGTATDFNIFKTFEPAETLSAPTNTRSKVTTQNED